MKKGGKTWWHLQSLCEKISFFPLYFPFFFPGLFGFGDFNFDPKVNFSHFLVPHLRKKR